MGPPLSPVHEPPFEASVPASSAAPSPSGGVSEMTSSSKSQAGAIVAADVLTGLLTLLHVPAPSKAAVYASSAASTPADG